MEMTYFLNSSIELMIASDGTDSLMCNELICKDGMGECNYTTYVSNIMII